MKSAMPFDEMLIELTFTSAPRTHHPALLRPWQNITVPTPSTVRWLISCDAAAHSGSARLHEEENVFRPCWRRTPT